MERASVTRLFKDQSTHKATLLLEAVESKDRFRITVPSHRAGILALEGHGLSDRCTVYGVLTECIDRLGADFGSVVISLDKSKGVTGRISVTRDTAEDWIDGDVVELVAFALHIQLPIYLNVTDREENIEPQTSIPPAFEDALIEIMDPKSTSKTVCHPDQVPEDGEGLQLDLGG